LLKNKHLRFFLVLPCGAAVVAFSSAHAATAYPARPVRVIVGFPPGSGTDMIARFVGNKLSERLGQQVVVDNRPGANGIIAAELVTKAAADGHTLLAMSISHTMNAAVYTLPFDAVKSFTAITTLGAGPLVLVANSSFPANSVKGLIDLARAKPNTVTYAISGTGGINHFAGGLFSRITGVQLINVPYKGGAQALTDLIGGQVHIMFGTAAITLTHLRSGRMKALGVSTPKRSTLLPDVPTLAESGAPGFAMHTWWGVLGPAGLPASVVSRLNSDIATILAQPETAKRLEAEGAIPSPLPSADFTRMLGAEIEKWTRVAREANIRAE
jgi:tripartite-type tricarboxylate transporter receptor subunit TctC